MVEVEFFSDFDTVKIYWPHSEELNKQLAATILKKEQEDSKGAKVTNRGGWHSKQDAHQWKEPCMITMIERSYTAVEEMSKYMSPPMKPLELSRMWANINRDGHSNYPHAHEAYWCGFYCVDEGSPDLTYPDNGTTHLVRGSRGQDLKRMPWSINFPPSNTEELAKELIHPATAGSLLLFPGGLLHYVTPYYGGGTRITVAFNFIEI